MNIVPILKRCEVFIGLNDSDLEKIAALSSWRREKYEKGYSIFYENLSVINLIPAVLIPALLILANSVSIKIRDISVIGYGDIKLVAVLMLFINVPLSLIALWFSSLIAIPVFYLLKITSKRISEANKVPYGFFISISYILIILFKSQVTNTYLSFIGIEV